METKNKHRSLLENEFSDQSQDSEKLNAKELLAVQGGVDSDLDEDDTNICILKSKTCYTGA